MYTYCIHQPDMQITSCHPLSLLMHFNGVFKCSISVVQLHRNLPRWLVGSSGWSRLLATRLVSRPGMPWITWLPNSIASQWIANSTFLTLRYVQFLYWTESCLFLRTTWQSCYCRSERWMCWSVCRMNSVNWMVLLKCEFDLPECWVNTQIASSNRH